MKKLILSISIFSLALGTVAAQSIDEIVAKHLTELGGEAKLRTVKTVEMVNTIKVQGLEMANQTHIVVNNAVRSESTVMDNTIIQAFDGTMAWDNTPIMMGGSGKPQVTPTENAGAIITQTDPFPLLDYAKKGTKVELLATEGVNFHLKLTPKMGGESEIWINAKTGLVSKQKSFQNGQDVEIEFSNYTLIEGVNFALHMEIMGGMLSIDTKSVKLNGSIDTSIFKMPIIK